jgi:serine/threonine-protein kinase RsbW
MTETETETVELTVPARAEFVRIVRLVMAGIGNSLAFNVEEIDDLKTAVGEAYNMFHPSEEHPLSVRTAIDGKRLVVEVTQRFSGALPRLFAMDNSMERGIGIILMKHLMDEVEYKTDSAEMQIRLIKYRK